MSYLGDPPENWLSRTLRCLGYFLMGSFFGLAPAAWAVAATSTPHIAWRIPILLVLGSGAFFCLLGLLTRGRCFSVLLRILGRHVNPRW